MKTKWIATNNDTVYEDRSGRVQDRAVCACAPTRNARKNAVLIAAAPDLLDACYEALIWIERDETTHGRKLRAGDALRRAIAKAERTT